MTSEGHSLAQPDLRCLRCCIVLPKKQNTLVKRNCHASPPDGSARLLEELSRSDRSELACPPTPPPPPQKRKSPTDSEVGD